MERISTSISDFEYLRQEDGLYVDKTDIIFDIINRKIDSQFFLSRPRRFGKSLLLSTIQYIFEGKRHLFDGLKISETNWDWEAEKCPVIKLDMSTCTGELKQVKSAVNLVLQSEAERIGVPLRALDEPAEKFKAFIEDAAASSSTGKIVLLVDEYDAPLLKYIGSEEVKPYQEFLKNFYTTIKATGRLQRFCMLTGVTKFSKVSIFSALNNLVDLTMDTSVSTLLGYTHDEVKLYFSESLQSLADSYKCKLEEAFDMLVFNYDGYCFDDSIKRVFNPVSLGRSLSASKIKSYWFETGTPGWLMKYVKNKPLDTDNLYLDEISLGAFEPANPDLVTVLFQAGYLTIASVDEFLQRTRYFLRFPNYEVEEGFNRWLAQTYIDEDAVQISSWQYECIMATRKGNPDLFVKILQSFFASIGYDLSDRLSEQAYQNITVAILRFIGLAVRAEVTTYKGRIDMVCECEDNVFIMELKIATGEEACAKASEDAIEQIKEREYAQSYLSAVRQGSQNVFILGITFDCETHNIASWASEQI